MTICECGKKYINPKFYESHRLKVHTASPIVVEEPIDPTVAVRFSKDVEITINGKRYFGTEIKAPNIAVAAEIVRIAREAYGSEILSNTTS